MKWYSGLEAIVNEKVPLADRTWYRLGGPACYFCTPISADQVAEIVRRSREQGLPLKILGGGANVLVRDEGFDGIVVHLDPAAFGTVRFDGPTAVAGAAADLPDLVRRTVSRGLAGLEFMAGIPGTVGGAVRMNAGGKFGEIGDSVTSVTLLDDAGELQQWGRERLHFEYRKTNLLDKTILQASFTLISTDPEELKRRYREVWEYKKQSQPFTRNNAGCVFKNPAGHKAGQLIDLAGLKGESCGGASVCRQHANFIVTEPHARTCDVLHLVDRIRSRVQQRFHVDLELEVDVW